MIPPQPSDPLPDVPPSPWLERLEPASTAPPLEGELRVDAAVVGAGYAGLHAALALRERGLSVALLEARTAGFGASGRNAGHLTPTIGKDLPTLLAVYGREGARELVRFAETAIRFVEDTLDRLAARGADAHYRPSGNIVAAVHPRQAPRLERAAETAASLGAAATYLDAEAMRKRGIPEAFACGVLEGAGGTLDPARYARGLRDAAVAAGVRLFEDTAVLGLDDGPRLALRTPRGHVRAEHVVFALNAWSAGAGILRRRVLPASVSLFETRPLTRDERASLGWPSEEGLYTAHEMLESYRLTARGSLVGGAKCLRYGFGGRILPDDAPAVFETITAVFRERFPTLLGVPIERCWSGPIAFTLDFLPALGRLPDRPRVAYTAGYAGHGVALASHCGRLAAGLSLGDPDAHAAAAPLVERFRPPLPPEPFRWLVVRGLTALFGAVDARLDRAARALRPRSPGPGAGA